MGGTALSRTRWACASVAFLRLTSPPDWMDEDDGKTTPGESRRVSLLSILTERMLVVTPASAPAGHALAALAPLPPILLRRALMTELLPTLG